VYTGSERTKERSPVFNGSETNSKPLYSILIPRLIYYVRVIRKVTCGDLLTKQAMKKILYAKNTYILKLLLNIVTGGTETLVSGNIFCMPVPRSLPLVTAAMFCFAKH
jgi:hypothetical protein